MININNEFFDTNDKDEIKLEKLKEYTFICDMIRTIRIENLKEIKELNKHYDTIIKPYLTNISTIIGPSNTEYHTNMTTYELVDGKIHML